MRGRVACVLAIAGLAIATVAPAAEPIPSVGPAAEPAPEVEVRDGLGNFGAKLAAGEPVTIAYVGGSITALPGWRTRLNRRLRRRYGVNGVREINAGLSATGSDVAACRLDDEVLKHGPDLVVIELAVNDAAAGVATAERALEGIVRKIWTANPRADVLLVYLFEPGFEEPMSRGETPGPIAAHEEVAARYGVPSIDVSGVVRQLHRSGSIALRGPAQPKAGEPPAFARDGVHPYPRGHGIYERAISSGLEQILAASKPTDHASRLEGGLSAHPWQSAHKEPIRRWMRDERWRKLSADEAAGAEGRAIELWESTGPGATLKFGFKGAVLKLYELRGTEPPGALEILIDGERLPEKKFRPLKPGPALRVLHVRYPFDPDKVHRVTIRVPEGEGKDARPARLGDLLLLGEVVR